MKKSAGFTLIELVIVIIILGILGAVAAPRLFNLQGDAYGANLNALKSSISTAATMANAKAQIQGVMNAKGKNDTKATADNEDGSINGYSFIEFVNGYPAANKEVNADSTTPAGILATLDGFEYDRYTLGTGSGTGDYDGAKTLTITPTSIGNATLDKDTGCVVVYTEAVAAEAAEGSTPAKSALPAKVEAFTGGC